MCRGTLTILRKRVTRLAIAAISVCIALAPERALAQQNPEWEITLAPLYLWAMETNGSITARNTTVPVFLDFASAADNLGGAFSFHFEAQKDRFGLFSDLNFVRLSSESTFTIPAVVGSGTRTIEGEFQLDNVFFEAGASYLVYAPAKLGIIGGLRSYTLSPKLEFEGAVAEVTPIDASRTSVDGFVGFTLRPALSPKWTFLSRADIGGGSAELTWTAMLGFEYRLRPSIGLIFGYKALGIDVGNDDGKPVREYDMTHYGPIFGLNLHWGRR